MSCLSNEPGDPLSHPLRAGGFRSVPEPAPPSVVVDRYADVIVITLSTTGQHTRAFSADTGMGEALVVAVKRGGGAKAPSDDDREDEEQPEGDPGRRGATRG